MGKVYVGEFGFDSLKEAQDYAKKVKEDPSYIPPVKEATAGMDPAAEGADQTVTTEVNDGFVPPTGPFFDPQEPGQEPDDTQDSEATQESDAASSEALPTESNTVVVETGLELETKEVEPEFMPDNYENMTDKQKESYDADLAQAAYESSSPEEQAAIDAEIEDFEQDILDEAAEAEMKD